MPLRLRLALTYGLLASLALVAGYGFYERAAYRNLDGVLQVFAAQSAAELGKSDTLTPPDLPFPVAVRLYDASGKRLDSAGNASVPEIDPLASLREGQPAHAAWIGILPQISPTMSGPPRVVYTGLGLVTAQGQRWRGYTLRLSDGRLLQIATSMALTDGALGMVRHNFLALAGLGALAVMLLGFLLSGPVLRPLARLARSAQAVLRGGHGGGRVPSQDELGLLADTVAHSLAGLQEERERLDLALSAAGMGWWEWDIARERHRWSPEFERLLGLEPGTFRGGPEAFLERVHPEDRERLEAIVRGARPAVFEYRVLLPDGGVRWLESRAQAYRDASGAVTRLLGLDLDISERRRAEQAAAQGESRYRALVQATALAVWRTFRPDGDDPQTLTWWSNLTGQSPQEAAGWGWLEALHPEDRERARAAWGQAFEHSQVFETEYRVRRRDGEYVYLEVRGVPILDEAGRAREWIGTFGDISARKWAEVEAQRSQQRLKTALEAGRMGWWELDLDSGELTTSPTCKANYGRAPQDPFSYQDLKNSVHPGDYERWQAAVEQAIAQGSELEVEYRVLWPDGSLHWVLVRSTSFPAAEGQPARMAGVSIDITSRKQAEEALRSGEERLRLALEAGQMGAWEWDLRTDTQVWSAEQERLFGLAPGRGTYSGEDFYRLVHPDDRERLRRATFAEGQASVEDEFRVVRPGGSTLWVASRARLRHDAAGRVVGMTGVNLDITERKGREDSVALLAEVMAELSMASDPDLVIQAVGERVLTHLGLAHLLFVRVDEAGERAEVFHDARAAGQPDLGGVYTLSEFHTPQELAQLRAGRAIVIRDVWEGGRPADRAEGFGELGIRSLVTVPYLVEGRWCFALSAQRDQPYPWSEGDAAFLGELAARVYLSLERINTEQALRVSREAFSALVENAPFGVYTVGSDFRIRSVNSGAQAAFAGIGPVVGRDLAEVLHILWPEPFASEAVACFRHTLATGESHIAPPLTEVRADRGVVESYDWQIHRLTLPEGGLGVVCYFYDLTEQKRLEAQVRQTARLDAYRLRLGDALRPLSDPALVQAEAARVLGEQLGVSRVGYFEVQGEDYVILSDYTRGVASLVGRFPAASFGLELLAMLRRGELLLVEDVGHSRLFSPAEGAALAALQIRAFVGIPLVKGGAFVAGLTLHNAEPRQWTEEEVALAQETAERIWAAVERAKAEAALRESQARLQDALEAAQLGTWTWDLATGDADLDPRAAQIIGVEASGPVNAIQTNLEHIHPEDQARALAEAEAGIKRGGTFRLAYRVVHRDGSVHHVVTDARVLTDAQGQPVRLVGTNRDVTREHEAEAALREGEARFRLMADNIPQLAWMADPDGYIFWYNQRWYEYTGTTPEEMRGWGWQKVHDPEVLPLVMEKWQAAIRGGEPFEMTFPLRGADGRFRSFLTRIVPLKDETGRVLRWFGSNTDISAQLLVERRLRSLQKVTAALAEAHTLAEVRRVIVGDIVEALGANHGALRLLSADGAELVFHEAVLGSLSEAQAKPYQRLPVGADHPAAEALRTGKAVFLHDSEELAQRYPALAEAARQSGEQARAHLPLHREDYTFAVLSLGFGTPCDWDADERAFALALADRAATAYERVRLAEEVRESEERAVRLQALTVLLSSAATPAEVVSLVLQHGLPTVGAEAGTVAVLSADGTALETIGSSGYPQELVAAYERFSLSLQAPLPEAVRSLSPQWVGQPEEFERRYGHPSQATEQRAWVGLPLIAHGRAIGGLGLTYKAPREFDLAEQTFLLTLADVCAGALDRARLFEAVQESEGRYRELSEAQKRFVADAAHELRAPLTAIQGNLDLLERFKNMEAEDRQEAVREAAKEAGRLARLVNDLLALARGDAGARVRLEPVALEGVLKEAFASAQGLVKGHRLELGAVEPLRVEGDPDRLKELTLILLDNALKYTPPPGRVCLSLARAAEVAEIRVEDSGIGIAPEDLPKVFERFYRADHARTPGADPGGTGLGLPIAKWIVESHGGQIWLESEPGKGTVAVVQLPLLPVGEASPR